jgi:bifunctional non-homologous end joining protein LigD
MPSASRSSPFDLPWLDGNNLTGWPLEARRTLLEAIELPEGVCVTRQWPGTSAPRLLEACAELGVEGVILKRLGSPYQPGRRSPDWRKLKVPTWSAEYMPRRASDERWRDPATS